jgi:anti-sigma B factor antagonist
MAMQMSSRDVEGVTILDLKGRLTLGEGTSMLREGVRACLNQSRKILLNLGQVEYIDSAGLGELVGCQAAAANRGAALGLLNVKDRVHGLLQVTKLYSVFEVFNSEDAAVLGMKAPAGGA